MFLTLHRQEAAVNFKDADTAGELYSGEASFCPQQWSFWIIGAFQLRYEVPVGLRSLALNVAHQMVDVSDSGATKLTEDWPAGQSKNQTLTGRPVALDEGMLSRIGEMKQDYRTTRWRD